MAAWALAATPAGAETLRLEGVFAAGAREASLLPTIGVDPFRGPQGDELSMAIERRLAKAGDDGVPHAELITPALRPDGLLTGRTNVSVSDLPYTEGRSRCVEKDKDGKCVKRQSYSVDCLRRSVSLRADLSMARHDDGRIVYAVTKARSDDDSACEDGGILQPVDSMLHSMTESIAQEVRLDLAPHRERYTIRVREDRDALSPDLADRFRQAVRLTKHDQPAACAAFDSIGEANPDHGPTLFNRALCAEQAGRYREAADLYARARVFGAKFDGDVTKGLTRAVSLAEGEQDVRRMAATLTASRGMR
jgi:hypothetical protein